MAVLDAYYALDRFGTWPAAGGYDRQSPWFAAAVRLIESERGVLAEEDDERRERRARSGGK